MMVTGSQKREDQTAPPRYDGAYVRANVFIYDMKFKTRFGAAHGCRGASAALARYAAELQLNGDVQTLAFSGGKKVFDPLTLAGVSWFQVKRRNWKGLKETFKEAANFLSRETEAELMARVAREEGVPDECIIVEGRRRGGPTSTNTAKNVEELLVDEQLKTALVEAGQISVIGHAYQTRRVAGTWLAKMQALCPEFLVVARSTYPFGFDQYNWEVPLIKGLVVKEAFETDASQSRSLISAKPHDVVAYDDEKHRARAERECQPSRG
jgi:hypothetical protein